MVSLADIGNKLIRLKAEACIQEKWYRIFDIFLKSCVHTADTQLSEPEREE